MKPLTTLAELSIEELIAIRSRLRQRFGVGRRGNILEIAFGMAEHHEQLDRDRPDSICFYVRHKRRPRARVDRIPAWLEFRLKRDTGSVTVRLATDVIHLGTRAVQPTGQRLFHRDQTEVATTGGVLAWRLPGQVRWTWGVLTVGHFFSNVVSVPEREARVRVMGRSGGTISGILLARSRPGNLQYVDAALVMVPRSDLVGANLIPENLSTLGKRIRSVDDLRQDHGELGFTYPGDEPVPIRMARFLPVSNLVPALGSLLNVCEATSQTGVFRQGRSGSLWAVQSQIAVMQHGGLPETFSRGWGQSLEFIVAWSIEQLAQLYSRPAHEIELRLMRVI